MLEIQLVQVPDAEAGYARVEQVLRDVLTAAWTAGRVAHVALSGGRSGAAIGARLGEIVAAADDGRVHLWIADERYVAVDDADRNDTPIIDALGDTGGRVTVHRHRPPDEATISAAADAYASELRAVLADAPFDLVLLSMGEDGHVASVFPGHVQPSAPAYAELHSPKPPAMRTTIALPRLANTRSAVLLALGSGKSDAVRAVLAADTRLPAVQLAATHAADLITDVPLGMWSKQPLVDPA